MTIKQLAKAAQLAQKILANTEPERINQALLVIADQLEQQQVRLLVANQIDIERAQANQLSEAMIDRLRLTSERIAAMAQGIRDIAKLSSPLRKVLANWQRPNGLQISRITVPIGVIAVIYESRPNVTADAAALCLKSGNAVILRGGSDSFHSSVAIADCIQSSLQALRLPEAAVQMVATADRQSVMALIQLNEDIDVLIPRGGKGLVSFLTQHSKIPMLKHLDGLCHTYVHQEADQKMAVDICCNAKMRRPGICGATETILIDQTIATEFLPPLANALNGQGCELVGDQQAKELCRLIQPAQEQDWASEYLAAKVAIAIVKDFKAAVSHIQRYSSQHTEAIISENQVVAEQFFQQVDSAIVMHNASTQFSDGGEFGMGAEIGIATGKLHARGPVGIEQLTTVQYQVKGNGQLRP